MKAAEAQNSPVLRSQGDATCHWSRLLPFPVLTAVLPNLTVTTRPQVVNNSPPNLLLWAL